MIVSHTLSHLREHIKDQKSRGAQIGLVPTMGALHQGHLSLIIKSTSMDDFTVVSIFVNPLQFSPSEDFHRYPRKPDSDIQMAESAGADLIFFPSPQEILGDHLLTFVDIEKLHNNLCGLKRPGHFRGVCTIVTKLFNIVQPNRAYFGQKDIQQLLILQKMTQDLNFNIDIIACPIVREADGLAMSSRNAYLSPDARRQAAILSQSIKKAAKLADAGLTSAEKMISIISQHINTQSDARIDYVSIVNQDLQDVSTIHNGDILALAVYFGSTRLIDNHIFADPVSF